MVDGPDATQLAKAIGLSPDWRTAEEAKYGLAPQSPGSSAPPVCTAPSVVQTAPPSAGAPRAPARWLPDTTERCPTRPGLRSSRSEAKRLVQYIVKAEDFLGERGQWAHKFRNIVDAIRHWETGGPFPELDLRAEFEVNMRELMAHVEERERQCSVLAAIAMMHPA